MESTLHDHDLAWRLADTLAGDLPGAERAALFLELGCGQYWDAITRMLAAAVRDELVVPQALMSQLCRWLDAYVGNVDEPAARALLRRLRIRGVAASTSDSIRMKPLRPQRFRHEAEQLIDQSQNGRASAPPMDHTCRTRPSSNEN